MTVYCIWENNFFLIGPFFLFCKKKALPLTTDRRWFITEFINHHQYWHTFPNEYENCWIVKNPFDRMSSCHLYLSAFLDELILIEPWSYFVPFLLGHWADGARGSSQGLSFGNSFHLLQHGSGSFCIHGESCSSSHHSQDHEHTEGLGLWLLIRVVRMQVSLHDWWNSFVDIRLCKIIQHVIFSLFSWDVSRSVQVQVFYVCRFGSFAS